MNIISKIEDIYNLKDKKDELIELEGFGNKSVDKLLQAIELSKDNSLERLLFGLGIPHVGSKTAKLLSMHYETLDNLMNASIEELTNIRDVGEIIAKSLTEYFSDEHNKEIINKLKEIGINTKYLGEKIEIKEEFQGKTFVLTGSLEIFTREEAQEKIESFGGKTSSSVSKKTSAVKKEKNPGSKYTKALSLGVTIWQEEEFLDKIKERN